MREPDRTFRAQAVPSHPGRRYTDANGVNWRVREFHQAGRPPALYFECTSAIRRVSQYPPDWRDLPTGELEILSRKT